jgi:predicted RNA-binding Zn-ribbon protein involved in translation (DUF1610 family)
MKTVNDMSMAHINDPPKHVKHAELVSLSYDSIYKKVCPACDDGMLLVTRNQKTLELSAEDRCILCGQQFIYDDIEEMRKRERG